MTTTEADELKKAEAAKASHDIEQILAQTRPKHAVQGVTSGLSNVVSGCVGGVGLVVLAPTVGAAAGMRGAGIVGGVVGGVGGAVVGVVGGATLMVGGALSGVSQVVRGVLNTPAAVMAPRQGKWWNELDGTWVLTDLKKEYETHVKGTPEDDADLLGDIEAQVEASSALDTAGGGGGGEVMEMYYYNVLEIGPQAEPSAIKRKYYVLARKYHPDKVDKDDKEAADKFKDIAEAYQVLSDPELRSKYDKEGRAGLSPDKTSVAQDASPRVDPATLFAFLFGSDKFHDYTGRLSTATSASVGDSPKVSVETGRLLQKRRVVRLAITLADKLQQWTEEEYDLCATLWTTEAADLSTASYGTPLVHLIGKVYSLSAVQFIGSSESGIGMPSIGAWASKQKARIDSKSDKNKSKMDVMRSGMTMMSVQQTYAKKLRDAATEEEKEAIAAEMESVLSTLLLKILWTTTAVDITNTLYEVIQMVLFDHSVKANVRERRAHGLKKLGEIFQACPSPEGSAGSEEEQDAKKLYEEAAFAAMLETIKKKEEAQQKAHVG